MGALGFMDQEGYGADSGVVRQDSRGTGQQYNSGGLERLGFMDEEDGFGADDGDDWGVGGGSGSAGGMQGIGYGSGAASAGEDRRPGLRISSMPAATTPASSSSKPSASSGSGSSFLSLLDGFIPPAEGADVKLDRVRKRVPKVAPAVAAAAAAAMDADSASAVGADLASAGEAGEGGVDEPIVKSSRGRKSRTADAA